jgi:hypothetical protein
MWGRISIPPHLSKRSTTEDRPAPTRVDRPEIRWPVAPHNGTYDAPSGAVVAGAEPTVTRAARGASRGTWSSSAITSSRAVARNQRSEYDGFHILTHAGKRGAIEVQVPDGVCGEDACELGLGGQPEHKPFPFLQASGWKLYDIVSSRSLLPFLLSPRAQEVLAGEGLRGIAFQEAEIKLKGGDRVGDYAALAVNGRAGALDTSLSERITIPPQAAGGIAMDGIRGLYFGLDKWDRSDVFSPQGAYTVIVTEAVREVVTTAGLTNFEFLPVVEYEQLAV